MNLTHPLSTPAVSPGQKTSLPLSMFEVTDTAIPVRRLDSFMIEDKLREDRDLVECPLKGLRPARWSALNEF